MGWGLELIITVTCKAEEVQLQNDCNFPSQFVKILICKDYMGPFQKVTCHVLMIGRESRRGARCLLPSVLLVCFSWRAGVGVR